MSSFSAQVADWVREVEEYQTAVFREAAQRVSEEMLTPRKAGGNMPVDTGYLRASALASTSQMPVMRANAVPAEGASYPYNAGAVSLAIAGAELGDTIYVGFTAAYARRMNYGFTGTDKLGRQYSQRGYLFVEQAAQRWQVIVSQVEAELAQRLGR